jgi:hypothetical protein
LRDVHLLLPERPPPPDAVPRGSLRSSKGTVDARPPTIRRAA